MNALLFERAGLVRYRQRARWDAEATELLGSALARWSLLPERRYDNGFAAIVASVRTADGSPAVLKIGFPHEEAVAEAIALEAWAAIGRSPRILRQDPWAWAMLLDRVEPGESILTGSPDESVREAAGLLLELGSVGVPDALPRLPVAVSASVADARAHFPEWRAGVAELGATPLVSAALATLDELAEGVAPTAIVHGDFNPHNILRSGDGLVVIDPEPMAGDPAFDLWPLLSGLGAGKQNHGYRRSHRHGLGHAGGLGHADGFAHAGGLGHAGGFAHAGGLGHAGGLAHTDGNGDTDRLESADGVGRADRLERPDGVGRADRLERPDGVGRADRLESARVVARHLDIAARSAELDAERAARWAFGRCGLTVTRYLDEGDSRRAATTAAELRLWAQILGIPER